MHSENQNNQQWKMRLEDTESLSAEVLQNKDAAWDKLYSNLHKKKTPQLVIWFRLAAACLVVATILTVMLTGKEKDQPSVTKITRPAKNNIPAIKNKQLVQEKNKDYALAPKQQDKKTLATTQKNNPGEKPVKTTNNNPIIISTNENAVTEPHISPTLPFDSTIKNTTVTAPIRKKLKIVHINELGQPAEEATADTRFSGRHGFELKIISGEIYNTVNTSSADKGLILFKSRNTSSN